MAKVETQVESTTSTLQKVSIAVAVISALGFIAVGWGKTWGFEGFGEQINETIYTVTGAINIMFGGNTAAKIIASRKEDSK